MTEWLLDTGPLVAYLDGSDAHHGWSAQVFKALSGPVLTCEAVVTEAFYLTRGLADAPQRILAMIEVGAIGIVPVLPVEASAVRATISRYADRQVDFADACLVRLVELHPRAKLITLDTDFRIYRRLGRHPIPVVAPWA